MNSQNPASATITAVTPARVATFEADDEGSESCLTNATGSSAIAEVVEDRHFEEAWHLLVYIAGERPFLERPVLPELQ